MAKDSQILAKAREESRKILLEPEARALCEEYGIPFTESKMAKTKEQAVEFAEEIGYPIVLKIVSPDIVHKSDVGGVALNLQRAQQVEEAYSAILLNVKKHMPKARIIGVLVQEMAPPSTEVIVGAIKDDQFGPAVMFGLGGISVEVLDDVAFRMAPVTKQEARLMITEIKAYPVLKGYRNRPPADIDAIAGILVNVSKLVVDNEEIRELDLNPVIVYEKGAITVDARIILE